MNNFKKIGVGIAAAGTLAVGGDAAILNETPIERVEIIGEERVEAKQIENRVETTFPWKDQAGIKVSVDLGEPTMSERIADKRSREVITETVSFMSEDGQPNGFKVDILLNEKPDTNVFCYAIEGAENYDFFYQPELTKEEIEQGAERPDEIVGSYAVYHKELKNHVLGQENYATGKVMHIPRPQVWELDNEEATKQWADLSYTEEEGLCVAVSPKFLVNATYPVRVDPTFGYTSQGASAFGAEVAAFAMRGDVSGTVTDVHAYLKGGTPSTDDGAQLKLFPNNAGSPNLASASYASSFFFTPSSTFSLFTISSLSVSITSPAWVGGCVFEGTGSSDPTVAYDSGGGTTNYSYISATNCTSGGSLGSDRISTYATYTAAPTNPQRPATIFEGKSILEGKVIIE